MTPMKSEGISRLLTAGLIAIVKSVEMESVQDLAKRTRGKAGLSAEAIACGVIMHVDACQASVGWALCSAHDQRH